MKGDVLRKCFHADGQRRCGTKQAGKQAAPSPTVPCTGEHAKLSDTKKEVNVANIVRKQAGFTIKAIRKATAVACEGVDSDEEVPPL
jgi:hypothetical protein